MILSTPSPLCFRVRMDAKYLDVSSVKGSCYRLESYRSFGTVSSVHSTTLRCYFIRKCDFIKPNPTKEESQDINLVSDKYFLEKAASNTIEVYQSIMKQVLIRTGPVIEMFDVQGSREKRLVVGFKQGTTQSFFSAMSDLYHFYDLYTTRKYVGTSLVLAFSSREQNLYLFFTPFSLEQFSNGVTICSFYLNPMPNSKAAPIESSIHQIIKEASLIYCLPTTPLQSFFQTGQLSGTFISHLISLSNQSLLDCNLKLCSSGSYLWLCWLDLFSALFE